MHINLESADQHTIQSYSDSEIQIYNKCYQDSIIISGNKIISTWGIHSVQELSNEAMLAPLLQLNPEIIIIGHKQLGIQLPIEVTQRLSKLRIGIENMSIGAACRTFNVLLSERRVVVAGIIW